MPATRTPPRRRPARRPARLAAVTVAGACAACLCACGGAGSTGSAGSAGGRPTVAALVSGTNVPYLATYAKRMKAQAAKDGVTLKVYSAKFDSSQQAQQFDQAISSKPDALIVNPVDAKAVVPSLLKARQAKIPVVASNTNVDSSGASLVKGFTGPNDELEGRQAAQLMAKALGGKGNVAVIQGQLGTTAQINRDKGFKEELAKTAPGIRILDEQPGNWDKNTSRSVAANFITRYGKRLDGIFGEDDTTASGAAQAVADAGRKATLKVVGLGGSSLGFDGVKDGSIVGTILQSPVQDAVYAVDAAAAVAKGKSIPATRYLTPTVITKANISRFTPEW
jgi:ribose transport system substrate-binding protein